MDPLLPVEQPSQMASPALASRQPSPAAGAPPETSPPSIILPLAGLVLVFVFAPLGFIVSIIALRRLNQESAVAKGLAVTGIVIGGLFLAAMLVLIALLSLGGPQRLGF